MFDPPDLGSRKSMISRNLKNIQILRAVCEKSPRGPPKTRKNRALQDHFFHDKHPKTLYLCAKATASKFPKPRNKFRFKFSRKSSLPENSKTARTVCGNERLGSPKGFQNHEKQSIRKTPSPRKTHKNIIPVCKNSIFEFPQTSKQKSRHVFSKFEVS